jgi:dipeptidyl aminopeptidase/acylaminoacyl peptidase
MRRYWFSSAMFALLVLGAHGETCNAAKKAIYTSPDSLLVAVVQPSRKPQMCESTVELRTPTGKVIARRSYQSADGEHGYGVVKAQWTPDSKYFVFSLGSSGGHQPWHSPVEYFNRRRRDFLRLDDALNNAVMNPEFAVTAPDEVTVDLYFGNKTLTVQLSTLHVTNSSHTD